MHKLLKTKLKNKELNTKFFANKNLMGLAKAWLERFSNKHKNEFEDEYHKWLNK